MLRNILRENRFDKVDSSFLCVGGFKVFCLIFTYCQNNSESRIVENID